MREFRWDVVVVKRRDWTGTLWGAGLAFACAACGTRQAAPPSAPGAARTPSAATHTMQTRTPRPGAEPKALALSEVVLNRTGTPGPRLTEAKALDEGTCRSLSGWQGDFDNCWISPLAGGTAARLVIQTECGGDSCDYQTWLFADGSPSPIPDAPLALSLDHRWGFIEEEVFHGGPMPTDKRLLRKDRRDGKLEPFAQCFAPALSPAGTWIVCRNRDDDVLRLPVLGGKLEVVIDVDVDPAHVLWVPHWDAYPSAVRFENGDLVYTVDLNLDALPEDLFEQREGLRGPFRVPWTE